MTLRKGDTSEALVNKVFWGYYVVSSSIIQWLPTFVTTRPNQTKVLFFAVLLLRIDFSSLAPTALLK